MNDRELLELAAKAAGNETWTDIDGNRYCGEPETPWNPLVDDGDALRLAVGLCLDVCIHQCSIDVYAGELEEGIHQTCQEVGVGSATRRAIVRAAAEIGRAMP